jgi:hypothetical protein
LGTPTASSTVSPTTGITFTAGVTSTFDILGVLVSLCPNVTGATAACNRTAPVTASLTATVGVNTGNYPAGVNLTNPATVIAAVSPGLADPTVPASGLPAALGAGITGGPAVLNSSGGTQRVISRFESRRTMQMSSDRRRSLMAARYSRHRLRRRYRSISIFRTFRLVSTSRPAARSSRIRAGSPLSERLKSPSRTLSLHSC